MGTHFKGSKKEVRALNTYIKLIRAADTLSSRINKHLSDKGLTASQFNILDALYHLGTLTQKELGNKLLKSGGDITMVIDNLEKRKLVKRKRGEKDRRVFLVTLTIKGTGLVEKILLQQVNRIKNEVNILSKNEQNELQRLCKKIGVIV
ncbi:MAG: MarR family transcriptional regulator [Ignavibacteriaceae bacterium]|jgi:MarR family transcriptional regulator, 2-MHQ and catechol-resistance regulon repressor